MLQSDGLRSCLARTPAPSERMLPSRPISRLSEGSAVDAVDFRPAPPRPISLVSHSRVKPKGPQTDPRPRLARPNPPSPNPPRYLLPNACLPPPPPNNPQPGQIFRPDNSNVSQRGRQATTGRAQRSITKLYAAFEDLVDYDFPMVLVDEWDEITPEALNQWWLVGRSPVRRRRGVATLAESCFSQNFRKLVIYIEKYLTTPHNIAQYSRTFQIPKAEPSTAMSGPS